MPVVRADSAQFSEAVPGRPASVSDDEADRTGTLRSSVSVRFHAPLGVTRCAAGSLGVITGHSVGGASISSPTAICHLRRGIIVSLPAAQRGCSGGLLRLA